jgi:PAS domain S-box-containing protein
MNATGPTRTGEGSGEVSELIELLHRTERRLEVLTAGEVDTVADSKGRTFLLQRAQERLRHGDALRQAAVLNALPANIAMLDDQGRIVSVNDRWISLAEENACALAHCGPGLSYLDVCDHAAKGGSLDAGRAASGIRSVLDGRSLIFSMEYDCHSAGEERWFLMTVTPLPKSQHRGAIVMHTDVTGRRLAERASRQTTKLLQAVVDGSPDAVFVKDLQGRYLLCNGAVARFLGRSIEDIIGRDDTTLFSPEDARAIADTDRTVFDSGVSVSVEKPLTSAAGPRRMYAAKVPYRNESGEVIGLIGISRDTTEQHRLTADLAAEHARLLVVQDVAKIGSWSLDFKTGVYEWSEQTHRICETEPGSFVPTADNVYTIVHPDDRAAFRAATVGSMQRPAANYSMEHRLALPSGIERVVEQRWQVFRDVAGNALSARGTCQDITERRLAERELRENQSLLSMAGRLAHVGAWSVELPPTRVIWSEAMALIHDMPPGTVPTIEEAFAFFVPEHVEPLHAAFTRCMIDGEPYDVEYEIVTELGRRVLVRAIGEAVRDESGTIRRVQGALQDLTQHREAELNAERLADKLANTLETISEGFFTLDREWRFTYLNKEAERLFQKSRENLIGRVLWEVYPEAIGTVFQERYSAAMAGASGQSFEAMYAPWAVWIGAKCYPSDEGLSVYFRDVTSERAARQRLELLEACVSQLNDVVLISRITDEHPPRRVIEFVNDAFVRTTGFSRDEILGDSPDIGYGPRTDWKSVERMRAALDRLEPVNTELVRYRKDGSWYWAEVGITPVGFAGEKYSHYVVIERDISERKRHEDTLRELNADLEARVQSRTAELDLARIQAEEANQAKSSFLATMSHEIRTPMNGVIGMIDVLEQTSLRSSQAEIVKTVRESAYALLTIIDDVLDFSKIEAGQFQIDHEPMNVEAVTEGVCDTLDHVAAASGVALMLFTDPAIPASVLGDGARLRQVLMNLIGNAVKFSSGSERPGRVRIRAKLRDRSPEQIVVEFRISDNGIGMDQAIQSRLFTPFTQAEGGATRRFGGSGLGLSISQRLAEMMGGRITVYSEAGLGSTFVLRLTLRADPSLPNASVPVRSLQGLPCLVIGGQDSATDDLIVYLSGAGASTQRIGEGEDVAPWFERCAPGICVVVIAAAGRNTGATLERCRSACVAQSSLRVRFVVIEHGRPPDRLIIADDVRHLAADAMHRTVFLDAVAQEEARNAPIEANPSWATDTMTTVESLLDHCQKGQILVAEDNEINQKVIRRQLALLGFAADIASTGAEALEYMKRAAYDIVLTDLHMPVMDGYELVRKVREAEAGGSRIPIIAWTANAVKGEAKRCHDVGMDDYMTKPVQLTHLRAMLEKWIPGSSIDEGALHGQAQFEAPRGDARAPVVHADLDKLVALVGNDPAVIDEMLKAFRLSAARSSDEMLRALNDDDAGAAANAAHILKSGARSIGAQPLVDVCAAIEDAAERGKVESLSALKLRFVSEMDALLRFLDGLKRNDADGGPRTSAEGPSFHA